MFIPLATEYTIKLIKGYLNIYNLNIERRMRKARLLSRFRKLSSHKIYVSKGEFKHTNHKVIITLYTYNRQKYNYLSLLKKRYISLFFRKKSIKNLNNTFFLIKERGFSHLEKANNDKFTLIKTINNLKIKNKFIIKHKSLYINNYLVKFYKKLVKNSLQKMKFYLYYRQLLYINESKYNYTYLQLINNLIEKIYNKKVEFNIINLKYNYLNSDILSESILLKITRNRRKILRYLNRLI